MMRTAAIANGRTLRPGPAAVGLAIIAGVLALLPFVATAADAQAGAQIFQRDCVACHTIGKGDLVGPDLKGVTAQRPQAWLQQWISAPDAMLAAHDPVATTLLHQYHDVPMPNFHLSAADVENVIAYLQAPAAGAAPAPASAAGTPAPATTAPVAAGNAELGKQLFMGEARFHNGGPPCMGCHSVAGIGALGGGQLGPDLTEAVTRYGGPTGLAAFVGGSPTPTMNAIWTRTPLLADERADVVAFLTQASVSRRPPQAVWQLLGLAVLGLAILLAIAGLTWRKRTAEGVRRPMLARQRQAARLGRPANAPRRS